MMRPYLLRAGHCLMNLGNNLHCFLLSGYLSKYTTLLLVVLLLFVMRCTTIIFYNFTVLPVNSALFVILTSFLIPPLTISFGLCLCLQMDPKFLRNLRYSRKNNKKSGEAEAEE